jgi:hypothetical protein
MNTNGTIHTGKRTKTHLDARTRRHTLLQVAHHTLDVREHEHRDKRAHHGERDCPESVHGEASVVRFRLRHGRGEEKEGGAESGVGGGEETRGKEGRGNTQNIGMVIHRRKGLEVHTLHRRHRQLHGRRTNWKNAQSTQ